MVLHGIELQHTEFHVISLFSIVLHGIAWLCFVLHGIVCLTMCSVTSSWYVKLWGLPRRVFTLLCFVDGLIARFCATVEEVKKVFWRKFKIGYLMEK